MRQGRKRSELTSISSEGHIMYKEKKIMEERQRQQQLITPKWLRGSIHHRSSLMAGVVVVSKDKRVPRNCLTRNKLVVDNILN